MQTFKDVFHNFRCKSLFLKVIHTLGIDSGFRGKPSKLIVRVKSLTMPSIFCRKEEPQLPGSLLAMEKSGLTPDLQNLNCAQAIYIHADIFKWQIFYA